MSEIETDDEVMRVRSTRKITVLEIAVVDWPSVSTPRTRWRKYHSWPTPPSNVEIAIVRANALADPKFFGRCDHCGEVCVVGYMHDDHTCQGCAERYIDVVH